MIFRWLRRRRTPSANLKLLEAFPASLKDDVLIAIAVLPEQSHSDVGTIKVQINGERLSIPHRVYFDVSHIDSSRLPVRQKQIIAAILTRDWDGFVRQKHLREIVALNHPWVAPFVVQLVGEYVVEIIQEIEANLDKVDKAIYADFLRENLDFLRLTEQRIISYWDCYYRDQPKEQYGGFRVLNFFKDCIGCKI